MRDLKTLIFLCYKYSGTTPENTTPTGARHQRTVLFDASMPPIMVSQATSTPGLRAERAGERVFHAWTMVLLSMRSCMERESLPPRDFACKATASAEDQRCASDLCFTGKQVAHQSHGMVARACHG